MTAEGKASEQTQELMAQESKAIQEGLADNDIHRLVRVTAYKRWVHEIAR